MAISGQNGLNIRRSQHRSHPHDKFLDRNGDTFGGGAGKGDSRTTTNREITQLRRKT